MTTLVRIFCLALALTCAPALAQWQAPDHSVPIGRGGSATGFKFATPGVVGRVLTDNGPSADPSFAPLPAAAPVAVVPDIATLKALSTVTNKYANLTAAGRAGGFAWTLGNYTTQIATDTNNGIFVKADSVAASVGAWVRQFDGVNVWTRWFGAVADYATDNTALINNMMVTANLLNTNPADGKQAALRVNVDGGVKFKSNTLQWLPASQYVYVYVRYFANSDMTVGVASGGLGTNELQELSINSGWPLNPFGSYVAETIFNAPTHPASVLNIQKNVDASITAHMPPAFTIQPVAAQATLASAAFIKDENLNRFRMAYVHYGTDYSGNGVFVTVETRTTDLQCAGCNGAGAWGASIPAVGAVVRGITSLSRYVVTGSSLDTLSTDWLSGTAIPGEFLINERAVIHGFISGNVLTVTNVLQGSGNIANGHRLSGMFANSGIASSITIVGQSSGTPGGVGVYILNSSQTVAPTAMAVGNLSAVGLSSATDHDALYTPMQFGFKGHAIFNRTSFATAPACSSAAEGAVAAFSDSGTTTWGANITGGGGGHVIGYCNGTNWTVMGK